MANDTKFKPGQSGNPETKFKPGNCHQWQPGHSGNPAGMPVVARDGTTQHYTTLTIPLTDVYLDPTLRMKSAVLCFKFLNASGHPAESFWNQHDDT